VRAVTLPEVPYGATAVRPDWTDLPSALRAAISDRLGAPVASATSAGGGFTAAFAAVLTTTAGLRAFVKAVPLGDRTAPWYAREAAITAALPDAVPAARPRWTMSEAGYFVLCLEAVAGSVPALPWSPAELRAALQAWSAASAALARPSETLLRTGVPRLPDLVRDELSWWSEIAAGREPMPRVPAWVPGRLTELAALERALPAHAAGDGMLHGDLRVDNVMIGTDGTAWLCDWTWPCLGAPWFDTVTLLVSAYASGLDTDALLHPWDAPGEGVDGALAAMGGYWMVQASAGPGGSSPHSRQHHRFSGRQALAWLADRRGWPTDET
jgi:aminoglycoside phosphotransferase (APT) family kinase protein